MNQPAPLPIKTNYYLTFVGPITYPATKSLRSVMCNAIYQGATQITLLLSSYGGNTNEGFALYNFMRGLPVELTIHNIGSVESIANVVFLAGSHRYTCPTSRFFNHDLSWTFAAETATRPVIEERKISLDKDSEQMTALMTTRTKLTSTQLKKMGFFKKPLVIGPADAKTYGIVDDIIDVNVPSTAMLWNVEY